jgi:hypothetical protein
VLQLREEKTAMETTIKNLREELRCAFLEKSELVGWRVSLGTILVEADLEFK